MSDGEFVRISQMPPERFKTLPKSVQDAYLQKRQANFAERATMDSVEGVRCGDTGESMQDYLARRRKEKAEKAGNPPGDHRDMTRAGRDEPPIRYEGSVREVVAREGQPIINVTVNLPPQPITVEPAQVNFSPTINVPEQQPSVVNVAPAEVTVNVPPYEPSTINVTPEVRVEILPQPPPVTAAREPGKKSVEFKRNREGEITGADIKEE